MKRYATIFTMMIFGLMTFAFAGQAKATAPENDDLENAIPLALNNGVAILTGNNISATKQASERDHAENVGGRSVWFKFTPQTTSAVRINLVETDFDTLLAVYTGTGLDNLQLVGSNDDCNNTCGGASTVDIGVNAGTAYYIAVDSYNNNPEIGEGGFKIVLFDNGTPFQDEYLNAYDLGTTFRNGIGGTIYNSTSEQNEPIAYFNDPDGYSVWYKFKAPFTFSAAIEVKTDFSSQIGVFTSFAQNPTIRQLTRVNANIDTGSFDSHRYKTVFLAQANKTYFIKVAGYTLYDQPLLGGNFQLRLYRHNLRYSLVVEDYDGDGKSDVAVFRPSNGTWYIVQSGNAQVNIFNFGMNGDKPQPGDYNGDGKADPAVFRPAEGVWYIAKPEGNPAQNFYGIQWGVSTDIPISSLATLQ